MIFGTENRSKQILGSKLNEGKEVTGMLLLEPVTAVQSSPVPVCEIACQGVKLFSLEQTAPVTFPHIRIGHKA